MAFFRRSKKTEQNTSSEETQELRPSLPQPPEANEFGRRSLDDQRQYLLSLIEPLPAFGMYLLDAWGMPICEDIHASADLPPTDVADSNGYAISSSFALPGSRVRGVPVTVGQEMPSGTDAVVTHADTNCIVDVTKQVNAGLNVRVSGSGVRKGELLIKNGTVLNARLSGLLAGAGFDRVLARPRPRVVVLDVVDSAATSVSERAVSEVNSHLIAAALKADGAQVWRVDIPAGTDEQLRDMVSDQLIRADLIVSAAGLATSQMVQVVDSMGLVDVADIAVSPGGKVAFGLIGEDAIPMFLLPSNPTDAYVTYLTLVRAVVAKLMGLETFVPASEEYPSAERLESPAGMTQFLTAKIIDGKAAALASAENGLLLDIANCDGLICLPDHVTSVNEGDPVRFIRLAEERI